MSDFLRVAQQFRNAQRLKFTWRLSGRTMDGEKESTAAHSWGCMLVADYLLEKLEQLCPGKYQLDRARVYELIPYHDLLESATGDVDLDPSADDRHRTKHEKEKAALPAFVASLPAELRATFERRLAEYEARATPESKFVKLVDVVEAELQCFFYKDLYRNWSEAYFVEHRAKHFLPFPELKFIFEEILAHHRDNGYFSQ